MRVLFIDTVHPVLAERLEENNFTCIDAFSFSLDKIKTELLTAEGIVIRSRFRMDEELLQHAPNLKFIARSGAGMENIDVEYCEHRNIALYNAPEGNRNAVAEHALGMLLSLFNHLNKGDKEVRSGIWDREGNRGIELDGKSIGLIGYGNNGVAFARKLAGFDVDIYAYDKYKSNFESGQVKEVELNELFEHADILSLHIPQNDETIFMVDEAFLKNFKKPIYIINLARGKIIKTSALVEGLKNGKILGACLDVLEYEKSSFESFFDSELTTDFKYLLAAENVILSPHVGGWTQESYFKLSNVLADKILQNK